VVDGEMRDPEQPATGGGVSEAEAGELPAATTDRDPPTGGSLPELDGTATR
jgi:hypothetical protein